MEDNRKVLQLNALIDYFAGGKKAEFARMIGISPQGVNTWLSRNTFDIELIYSKCEGVSAEWLLTGKGEMLEKKTEENAYPKCIPKMHTQKDDMHTQNAYPKQSGTVSAVGSESAPPENVFSGLTQEEVNEELRAGIREHLLDMFESGRAYPAAIVRQYQDQVKDLTVQLTRLEYENAKLLAELAALKGKTGVSEVAKTDEDVSAVK